jgi:hypothetical protein
MSTSNIILLVLAIGSVFIFSPAFFIIGTLAAFKFILKNFKDSRPIIDNPENPTESTSSPTEITYHYLRKHQEKKVKPILIPKIETADLSGAEKQEWQRIVNNLRSEN